MNEGLRMAAKALGIDVEAESAEFGEVFARYINTPQWMKAPNGKPSNLTVRQWIQVRTPAFKKMAGDWEAIIIRNNLINNVIAYLEPKFITVKPGEKGPIAAAMRWLRENPQENAKTVIGDVAIRENGMQASFSHTRYQNKLDTLPAIRRILETGIYLGFLPDKDGATLRNHYFAGKVHIGNDEHIVFIRVHDPDGNENMYYVHEVFTEDEIKKAEAMQTSTAKNGQRPGKASALYKNILQRILNANPHDVIAAMDENGEPKIVQEGQFHE